MFMTWRSNCGTQTLSARSKYRSSSKSGGNPRQPVFAEAPKTVWRLFNAATEIMKGDLWRLPARTRAVHTVLDDVCGLERNAIETAAAPAESVEFAI